jgi:aryl-alcohol dehydrogenase-like predicted oxidoreductase
MVGRVKLANGALDVSRVSLGLSHLHHLRRHADRERLLNHARDLGITHFDTARLYGDGLSERALGRAMRRWRGGVTVTTKFGLLPVDWLGTLGWAAAPVWVMRSAAKRANLITWPKRSYDIATMQRSLERSLRLLQTDYVDIFSIHEPRPSDLDDGYLDLLASALDAERRAGRIRFTGIAGGHALSIARTRPGMFDIVQAPESASDDCSLVPEFTYGAISSPRVSARGDSPRMALKRALLRRPQGSVLVGTTSTSHLEEAAAVASELADR